MKNLLILLLVFVVSCSTTKKTTVQMPKWPKEKKATKREIRNYTKNFVNNLFDSTKFKDTSVIYDIKEN